MHKGLSSHSDLNKKDNKKYDDCGLNKISQPDSAVGFPSPPARARLLCAFAGGASGSSRHRTEAIPAATPLKEPNALFNLTTGIDNTALGFQALYNNTTGS